MTNNTGNLLGGIITLGVGLYALDLIRKGINNKPLNKKITSIKSPYSHNSYGAKKLDFSKLY